MSTVDNVDFHDACLYPDLRPLVLSPDKVCTRTIEERHSNESQFYEEHLLREEDVLVLIQAYHWNDEHIHLKGKKIIVHIKTLITGLQNSIVMKSSAFPCFIQNSNKIA